VTEFTGGRLELSAKSEYAVPTRQFIGRLSEQVSNELNITDIHPDTLIFLFDKVASRLVKVRPNVSFELKQQHFLNDMITTIPDSVVVSGPESILDTLSAVSTSYQHYKDVDHTIRQNIPLIEYKNLILKTTRVLLEIPVEEYTEKLVTVPVTIKGLPQETHINLFPGKVNVSFMIALSRFKEVEPGDFRISANYEDIKNKLELLPLKIEAQPSYVHSVSLSPEQIEYLIEK
jgi:YbbR domain-containing protein